MASAHIALVDAAAARLLRTLDGLTEADARAPSRLDGWTRGHLLTHLARSADGMGNLMIWADTGVETPMYAEPDGRAADIEAGAGRAPDALIADVQTASRRWSQRAAALPDAAWATTIRRRPHLPPEPASNLLPGRLFEVEFHHVDLGLGYTFANSPAEVREMALSSTRDRLKVAEPFVVLASDTGRRLVFPADAPADALVIKGREADLLAWLTGRGDGDDLHAPGLLPTLPPWT